MKIIIVLLLVVIAIIFFEIKQPWIGAICIIITVLIGIAWVLKSFFSGTKKVAKAVAKGIPAEIEKAEGQYPSPAIWEEGIKEAGDKVGKQLFAPGDYPQKNSEWTLSGGNSRAVQTLQAE